jgi:WD40 repeat protein
MTMTRRCLFLLAPPALAVVLIFLVTALSTSRDRTLFAQNVARESPKDDTLPAGALARLETLRWRHADTITFVAFLADGSAVLTAGQDHTLRLWSWHTGNELGRITLPAAKPPGGATSVGPAVALARDSKIVATAVAGHPIQLWDLATGREIRKLRGPSDIARLLFAPDDTTVAACTRRCGRCKAAGAAGHRTGQRRFRDA